MDFQLTTLEADLLAGVEAAASAAGSGGELLAVASAGGVLSELEETLSALLHPASLRHERLLVVEHAARLGLPVVLGPRVLVGWEVLGAPPPVPVVFADLDRPGPARNGPAAEVAIMISGGEGWVVHRPAFASTPVESTFGYPYAEVTSADGAPLDAEAVAMARSRWHLSLAAEIAGTARGGLDHLSGHLVERTQFGRTLSTFQALRHRVAELAVSTEAASWLARKAAWHGDPAQAAVACSFARTLAAWMAPELVQLTGARGFTREFPVHLFASRLEGLRLEAGSAHRIAREHAALLA